MQKLVNLQYKDLAGAETTIGAVDNQGACHPTQGGWYYDAPAAPTQLVACEQSCQKLNAGGEVQVIVGCPTVRIVPEYGIVGQRFVLRFTGLRESRRLVGARSCVLRESSRRRGGRVPRASFVGSGTGRKLGTSAGAASTLRCAIDTSSMRSRTRSPSA